MRPGGVPGVRPVAAARFARLAALALALALTAAGSLLPRTVQAQQDEASQRAMGHFAEGKRLYNLGRFSEATHYFVKAYEARPLPLFLYNLGQCHRLMGDLPSQKRAVFYYRGYLNNAPEAADRTQVERTIASLEARITRLEAEEKERKAREQRAAAEARQRARPDLVPGHVPPPRREPARSAPFYKTWWFWTAVGAVVVGTGLGVGLGVAGSVDDRVPEGPSHSSREYKLWGGGP